MLRAILALAVGFGALSLVAFADDKKEEKKLEGKLQCTKCSLSETDKCGNALVVKEGGKDVTYYLKDKGAKQKYHAKICQEPKDAVVTGKIEEKDGKKYIVITEEKQVEFK
jgi:hypothetical protein